MATIDKSLIEATEGLNCVSIGVDVGMRRDSSAVAVTEVRQSKDNPADVFLLTRFLEKLPRVEAGSAFRALVHRVASIADGVHERILDNYNQQYEAYGLALAGPDASEKYIAPPPLPRISIFVDSTGMGESVPEYLNVQLSSSVRKITRVNECHFNYGAQVKREHRVYKVGKWHLVTKLKVLVQSDALRISPEIVDAQEVIDEFMTYEGRIDERGTERYGAFETGAHDDRVTALGLSVLDPPSPNTALSGFYRPEDVGLPPWGPR